LEMNIFLREMKAHRKALIFWCIGILFMVGSGMGKYQTYAGSSQSLKDIIAQMPKSVATILGFTGLDVTKISGYFGMLYLYLILMATIHAALIGAGIIAKEERDKTSEFLYVKPVSRNKIITAKLLAALACIIIFNLVTTLSSLAVIAKYAPGQNATGDILILMGGMFMLQLIFMSIGTAVAALSKKPKSAASVSTAILLVTFILSIVIDLNANLDKLKYLTPFKYFAARDLINSGGFDPVFVSISVILIIALTVATYVFYRKRDLNV